jgi:hypothetical protein
MAGVAQASLLHRSRYPSPLSPSIWQFKAGLFNDNARHRNTARGELSTYCTAANVWHCPNSRGTRHSGGQKDTATVTCTCRRRRQEPRQAFHLCLRDRRPLTPHCNGPDHAASRSQTLAYGDSSTVLNPLAHPSEPPRACKRMCGRRRMPKTEAAGCHDLSSP